MVYQPWLFCSLVTAFLEHDGFFLGLIQPRFFLGLEKNFMFKTKILGEDWLGECVSIWLYVVYACILALQQTFV